MDTRLTFQEVRMQTALEQDIQNISLFFEQHNLREVNMEQLQSTIQFLQTSLEQCKEQQKSEALVHRLTQARHALKRAMGYLKRNTRERGFYESIRTAQRLIDEALAHWNGEKGS